MHGIRSLFAIISVWLNLWTFCALFNVNNQLPVDTSGFAFVHRMFTSINDLMFVISGLLLCYTWLPQFERNTANFTRYLANRVIRTLPTILGVLLATIILDFATGSAKCAAWWSPLIYVNNWLLPKNSVIVISQFV